MSTKLQKKRSPLEIGGIIVIFLLLLAIICTFVLYGVFKDSNTAPKVFGYRVYIMNGEGMEPRIPKGSAVFVNEGVEDLGNGKVILCSIDGTLAVVGYVSGEEVILADGSTETRHLVKYDQGADNEIWGIGDGDIIGVAKTYSKGFGSLVNFASSKAGMLTIVIIPCALLMAYELVMLFKAKANKKDKDLQDAVTQETPDEEIERLREEILKTRKEAQNAKDNESLNGTKSFKLEFTSDKNESDEKEDLSGTRPFKVTDTEEAKTEQAPITDSTIQLRTAKSESKSEPKPAEQKTEFTSKPDPSPSIDVTKMTSSDIDELIKMLEAEKSRLENK